MKPILLFLFLLIIIFRFDVVSQTKVPLYKCVNPMIGTGGHGHTFPGATMPFGACQLSPDTRLEGWDGCSGYHYSDSVIYGFSHTHLSGTGCSDYGDILLMPTNKKVPLDNYQYASTFSHKNESANAGYYQVFLDSPQVNVELTTTLHGGVHHYIFKKGDPQYIVLDLKHRDEVLDSKMQQVDAYTIRGFRFSKAWAANQKLFYEIKFSKPIKNIYYQYEKDEKGTTINSEKSLHCILQFEHQKNTNFDLNLPINEVLVKCAISGVDEKGASKNLEMEMPHWEFEKYKSLCEQEWEIELNKIQIIEDKNENENQKITFYTALYHTMIHPSIYNDVDGRYRGRDDKIHHTENKFNYYTVFSLWDTYRALHPLLSIIDVKRTNDFINTFIKQYEQGGRLPIWELSSNETNCMIGYHAVSVIWDAYHKGIRDYDIQKAYEAMKSIATDESDYEGIGLDMKMKEDARDRAADADALESYCKFGYVRSDDSHESVSKTLEYAYDDWCIAQMAKALGYENDFQYYNKRSSQWINVFDPTSGFMRARKNSTLYHPFSPYTVDNNYTEANAWQYSFYVPHEMQQLIELLGGEEKFKQKLDELFAAKEQTEGRTQADITGLIGQYAHGNEPSHHIAYLYNFMFDNPSTRKLTNKISNEFYKNEPDGLIGNEDCGQMSAWYIFNAMGFYPTCPGDNSFQISEPIFNHILLNNQTHLLKKDINLLPNQSFCTKDSQTTIQYDELFSKHKIEFISSELLPKQNPPPTFNTSSIVPFIIHGNRIFSDSQKIELATSQNVPIYYAMNGEKEQQYQAPISIDENTQIIFHSQENKFHVQVADFSKLRTDRKIILKNEYNQSYHAGGAQGLIDGIYGKLNWRAGDWQGYQGQDVEIITQFQEPTAIHYLAANFLEDQNSWIFYPKEIAFYVANDTTNWKLVNAFPTEKSSKNKNVSITKFDTNFYEFKPEKYRYAKVIARNFGPMPQWHEGRGHPTFIFIDEFEVR